MSAPFDPLQMISAIQGLRGQQLQREQLEERRRRRALETGIRVLQANPEVDLSALLPGLGVEPGTQGIRALQEVQKAAKKRLKEKQTTPTAGQENRMAEGLAQTQTSGAPLESLLAAFRGLEKSDLPEASQQRIVRLGGAESARQRGEQRGEQREILQERREKRLDQLRDLETFQVKEQFKTEQGRTQFERIRNRLASGSGTPTQQALDRLRMHKLTKGDQLTGRIRLPDGTAIDFGESALRASRKEELTDRFVRQKGTLQDLDKTIGLIEEQASRAGLLGKARRASGTALGLVREVASSPFGNAFVQSMNQRAQQMVSNGEASESLLRKFEDAQAAGALESLEVSMALQIADALREGNRFSTKLFEEIRKTVDIDSSTTAARVLARLRDQRERIRRKQSTTRRLLEGKGASLTEQGPEGVRLTPEEESLVEEALGRGGG